MIIDISDLQQLSEFAVDFASKLNHGDVIFLKGDLGSGKTTLTQLILKSLLYKGRVKSPTYAIYETYQLSELNIIHMDLYRLSSPEELYYLAMDEIFTQENIVIIEWPEKGSGVLPTANKTLTFELKSHNQRSLKIDIT